MTLTIAATNAATIEFVPVSGLPNGAGLISISGTLDYNDGDAFRQKTSFLNKGVVEFSSDGGNVLAAIEIGTEIRMKNLITAVPDGSRCASACALAWLGGATRYMGRTSLIGFHAAYVNRDGFASESGSANALVGAYLNRLGLTDKAILYVTQTSPADIKWLSVDDAKQLGIDVQFFRTKQADVVAGEIERDSSDGSESRRRSDLQEGTLWTVQAVNNGNELSCDAFASGMMLRPKYEFRFRRTKSAFELIISYDGPRVISRNSEAKIIMNDVVAPVTLLAIPIHFGTRNAIAMGIDAASFDWNFFRRNIKLQVRIGKEVFTMATLPSDHVDTNFSDCLRTIHID